MCVFSLGTVCLSHTGDSQTRGHFHDEEPGACLIWRSQLRELGLFSTEKRSLRGALITVYKYQQGGCEEGRARLFCVVPCDRTRGIGHKVKHRRLSLNTREQCLTVRMRKHWHRMPREFVGSPSLEAFKSHLDMVLTMQL